MPYVIIVQLPGEDEREIDYVDCMDRAKARLAHYRLLYEGVPDVVIQIRQKG